MDETLYATIIIGAICAGIVSVTTIATQGKAKWSLAAAVGLIGTMFLILHRAESAWIPFGRDLILGAGAGLAVCAFVQLLMLMAGSEEPSDTEAIRNDQKQGVPGEARNHGRLNIVVGVTLGVLFWTGLLSVFIWMSVRDNRPLSRENWRDWAADIAEGAFFAIAAVLLVGFAVSMIWPPIATALRSLPGQLNPNLWTRPDGSPPAFSGVDIPNFQTTLVDTARRWFVAVAASTGAVVFSLMSDTGFFTYFGENFKPVQFVSALFVVAVAIALIGPLQEFARNRSWEQSQPSEIEDAIIRAHDRRSVIRLALVFAFALILLELFNNALDQAIQQDAEQSAFIILFGSLAPAVVSYYWCASLQSGANQKNVARISFRATQAWYIVTCYLPGVAIGFLMVWNALPGMLEQRPATVVIGFIFIPFLGALFAWLLGFFTAGIYALVGGRAWAAMERYPWIASVGGGIIILTVIHLIVQRFWTDWLALLLGLIFALAYIVIDLRSRRSYTWRVMATLGGALIIGSLSQYFFAAVLMMPFTDEPTVDYQFMLAGGLGWFVGLIAAGFPRIVMGSSAFEKPAAGP